VPGLSILNRHSSFPRQPPTTAFGALPDRPLCAGFVASVNRLLSPSVLELTPPEYFPQMFREFGVDLIQVNTQGHIAQIAFESTREVFSTEKFRVPFVLEGEVRAYNQEMLERTQIRSQALFFCLEHFYEWLHGRTESLGTISS
jgi:hypothetical protein